MTSGLEKVRNWGLTPREQQVFKHLLTRASYEEIAHELECSVKNVEFHASNILRKAGEKSRLGLALSVLGPIRRATPAPGRAPEHAGRRSATRSR